jgi:hypothetical protein
MRHSVFGTAKQTSTDGAKFDRDSVPARGSVLLQSDDRCGCLAAARAPRVDAMDHTLELRPPLAHRRAGVSDSAIRLASHATLARELPAGACIAVQSGRVWLTQTGDANDYFVDAGQRHVVVRAGRVVIESFTPQATLRVLRDAPAAHPGFP